MTDTGAAGLDRELQEGQPTMARHTVTFPVTDPQEILKLRAGDEVTIQGHVIGVRDSTQVRIFDQGDEGQAVYVILSGRVAIIRQDDAKSEVLVLGPGQFFGEIALLTEGNRTATVAAVKESRLLMLEATEFRKLTAEHPDLRAAMEKIAAQRQPLA